jgi:DNA-binding NarL/FixJ family response regulator
MPARLAGAAAGTQTKGQMMTITKELLDQARAAKKARGGKTKVTQEVLEKILRLYVGGMTERAIAQKLFLHHQTIHVRLREALK